MPLIPRDFGGEVEVEVDGDVYHLRRYLGWYHRAKAAEMKGVAIHVKWGQVKDGDIRLAESETVPLTLDAMEEVHLQKLMVWLARWSHKEPISTSTVKRLPPAHAARLLREIERLEADQEGPASDSPLPGE